ncbi:MAG: sulfur carrier protein ThiS [Candidatus Thiothrix putei]|uniref:Sulfur carrier protein ThiS n=1 Tax=Candidatus Thiothrix putei TaxID=3080811 RepID=A0AA95HF93_9GAMM|nr:MAG: sulfur carrier protein ThiS [Candidatus Thiothrix putei]
MEILVNGASHIVPVATTMTQLLNILTLQDKRLAVEINQELLVRSQFDTFVLQPHDTVEIVHAIGGG